MTQLNDRLLSSGSSKHCSIAMHEVAVQPGSISLPRYTRHVALYSSVVIAASIDLIISPVAATARAGISISRRLFSSEHSISRFCVRQNTQERTNKG